MNGAARPLLVSAAMMRFRPIQHSAVLAIVALLLSLTVRAAEAQSLWSPAVDLFLPPQPPAAVIGTAGQPDVDNDTFGNAVAVWSDWLNGTNSVVRASRFIGATESWSASVILSTPNRVATEARVAVAPNGDAVAVWQEADGARALIYSARLTGGAWSVPLPLSAAGDDDVLADVAIDQTGNAIALWVRRSDGLRIYRARYSASSGTWGGAVPLSASAVRGYPRVEFDGSSNAIAVWVSEVDADHSVIKAARYVGVTDTWSAIADISAPDQYAYWPELAVNASGNAVAVWTYGPRGAPGAVVQAARFNVASLSWPAPQTLSELAAQNASPRVAIDATGRATAVWQTDTGATRLVQASRHTPGTASWTPPFNLAGPPVTNEAGEPRVAMNDAGNAVATWVAAAGSGQAIRAAFFNIIAGTWTTGATVSPTADVRSGAPAVTLNEAGRAVLVWQTGSTGADHAKASHASVPTGSLLGQPTVNFPEVTLAWTAPQSGPPASSYTVIASASPNGPTIAVLTAGGQQSLVVAAPAGTYYVRVYAAMGGDVVPSNEVRVDVNTGPIPTAPLGLSGTVTGSVVNLTWNPPANAGVAQVQTYVIEAGSRPGATDIANFATGTPTPGYAAVVPNGNYYVRVRASRSSGLGPPTPDIRIVVGPPPPGASVLSGGATGPGTVLLTWTPAPAPGVPVTAYQLQAGSAPGQSDITGFSVPATQLGYAAAAIPPGTYYVRIVALSAQGPGTPSNELVVVIP